MKNIFESYKTTVLGLIILAAALILQFKAVKLDYELDTTQLTIMYGLAVGLVLAPDKVIKSIFALINKKDA